MTPTPLDSSIQTMTDDVRRRITQKYCPRFGQVAVEFGYITEAQLAEALVSQVHQELEGRGHRLLGEILFRKKLVSASQIDQVMRELLRRAAARDDEKLDSDFTVALLAFRGARRAVRCSANGNLLRRPDSDRELALAGSGDRRKAGQADHGRLNSVSGRHKRIGSRLRTL